MSGRVSVASKDARDGGTRVVRKSALGMVSIENAELLLDRHGQPLVLAVRARIEARRVHATTA